MNILRAIGKAFKLIKAEKAEQSAIQALHDDPITVELIRRIAREYDYHFEIVQRDGTILRFFKEGVEPSKDISQGAFW